jgi:hypothetical protein
VLHQEAPNSRKTEQPFAKAESTACGEYGILAAACTAPDNNKGRNIDSAAITGNIIFFKTNLLVKLK